MRTTRMTLAALTAMGLGAGCSASEGDEPSTNAGSSVAQSLVDGESVLGWFPGVANSSGGVAGSPPSVLFRAGLFEKADLDEVPLSALQDAFTARNDALKPAFRKAFEKYRNGTRSDAHPACPSPTAPNVVVNGYAKPYEFAQTEFLGWLAANTTANTTEADFLSPAARRVNTYRGNQECPLTSTDSTLTRTFGQRVRFEQGAIQLTTDNAVNPWRWVAPINSVHHHEQPSLYVALPVRDPTTKEKVRALLARNLKGDLSERVMLDYEVDLTAIDLRATMGESSAIAVVGPAPGQDLLSATYHNTHRLPDEQDERVRFSEYLDKRFVAPSLQVSVAVNWRETPTSYRLSSFSSLASTTRPLRSGEIRRPTQTSTTT